MRWDVKISHNDLFQSAGGLFFGALTNQDSKRCGDVARQLQLQVGRGVQLGAARPRLGAGRLDDGARHPHGAAVRVALGSFR